jgi:hypothetical protein
VVRAKASPKLLNTPAPVELIHSIEGAGALYGATDDPQPRPQEEQPGDQENCFERLTHHSLPPYWLDSRASALDVN